MLVFCTVIALFIGVALIYFGHESAQVFKAGYTTPIDSTILLKAAGCMLLLFITTAGVGIFWEKAKMRQNAYENIEESVEAEIILKEEAIKNSKNEYKIPDPIPHSVGEVLQILRTHLELLERNKWVFLFKVREVAEEEPLINLDDYVFCYCNKAGELGIYRWNELNPISLAIGCPTNEHKIITDLNKFQENV